MAAPSHSWRKGASPQRDVPLSILRRRQVEARTGLSRSTIYERIKAGTFPTPISLGGKAVGWVESEISDWLADQVAKSREAA